MLHVGLQFLWPDAATNASFVGDVDKLPPQSRTFRLTKTADGYVALITVANDQFDGLLRATGQRRADRRPQAQQPAAARPPRRAGDAGGRARSSAR